MAADRGEYLRLCEVCKKRGLRPCLAVGPLRDGARQLKRLKIRGVDDALLVSVEIKRSLDRASREALHALKNAPF